MPRGAGEGSEAPGGEGGGRKDRANSKRSGEISEAAFLHKAVSLGFKVTKPWGDSERYDFVVDSGKRLWRVQIKCTGALRAGGYHIQPIHYVYGEKKVVYTADEIDVLAAHIVPLDVWYVVPVQALAAGTSLRLYPEGGCERPRFEKYKEAWELLRGTAKEETAGAGGESGAAGGADGEIAEGEATTEPPGIPGRWSPAWPPLFKAYLAGKK
jgi:PD-(D/E)XK endonuclease